MVFFSTPDVEKRENPVCHFVTPLDGSMDLDVHRPVKIEKQPCTNRKNLLWIILCLLSQTTACTLVLCFTCHFFLNALVCYGLWLSSHLRLSSAGHCHRGKMLEKKNWNRDKRISQMENILQEKGTLWFSFYKYVIIFYVSVLLYLFSHYKCLFNYYSCRSTRMMTSQACSRYGKLHRAQHF